MARKGGAVKVVIVGGTSFVGRAIAWAMLGAGHELTVINRGVTPCDLPSSVTRLVGDRQRELDALRGREYDLTIDVTAYRPHDVVVLADALGGRGGHLVQISSISAYNEPVERGARESTLTIIDDPRVSADAPVTAATYGALKAASERAAHELFESVTIVRPTYVIGAHDATLRFPYWVERMRRGGAVAVPGPKTTSLQYVDARDLADFVAGVASARRAGEFHVAGPFPAPSFFDVVHDVARRVAPAETTIVEVEPDAVHRHGLDDRFPLWPGAHDNTLNNLDSSLAIEAGLVVRPLHESIDDVFEWWGEREFPLQWLNPDDEARLIDDRSARVG